jgi:hypothetical protein
MARSSCPLLRFHLAREELADDDAEQCLRDMPSTLVSLDFSAFGCSDRVLNLLSVGSSEDNGTGCICRRLERIRMGSAIGCTEGMVANMVESRMYDNTSLTNIQISCLKYVSVTLEHVQDAERLAKLKGQGLQVDMIVVSGDSD